MAVFLLPRSSSRPFRPDPQGSLSETATLALIYTKFTSFAFPLRPLLAELEKRATAHPDELGSLLDECHAAWMTARRMLMSPRVEREVKRMEPGASGLPTVDLVRVRRG